MYRNYRDPVGKYRDRDHEENGRDAAPRRFGDCPNCPHEPHAPGQCGTMFYLLGYCQCGAATQS